MILDIEGNEIVVGDNKFLLRTIGENEPKTNQKILEENGITSYELLSEEYEKILRKESGLSKGVREIIKEVYLHLNKNE